MTLPPVEEGTASAYPTGRKHQEVPVLPPGRARNQNGTLRRQDGAMGPNEHNAVLICGAYWCGHMYRHAYGYVYRNTYGYMCRLGQCLGQHVIWRISDAGTNSCARA